MNNPSADFHNLFQATQSHASTASAHTDAQGLDSHDHLNELFEELNNPMSFWQDLRITAMSGTDYVFVPSFVYSAFGASYSMTRFMTELSCAFSLDPSRVQIICIGNSEEVPTYSKVVLEWAAGSISQSHLELVPSQSTYYDFISSMYQYSSSAVGAAEH